MAESNEELSKRIDQYMNLMVDLRVAQVVTDQQINQLGKKVERIAEAVDDLRETVSAMVPIVLKHQESIDAHTKNIEDLYRSQGLLLRRLFGEDQ